MWSSVALFVVCLTGLVVADEHELKRSFQGYTVLRVTPSTDEQVQFLRSLEANHDRDLDFWSHPRQVNHPVDIMVAPQKKESFVQTLEEKNIPKDVMMSNVGTALKEESLMQSDIPMDRAPKSFFSAYQRLGSIYSYLDELAEKYPRLVSTRSIGKSSQGRDLKIVKISSGGKDKPIFWLDGGIHAREWVSPATVTYITGQLVEGYGSNAAIKELVDAYDFYILPVHNPDGYEYTHTNNRMWRKTLSPTNSLWGCRGTDPNRNWGYKWRTGGSSTDPCSDTYAGPSAFSEPETKAVSDYILSLGGRVKIFVTVHSYSQLWLMPWGWTSNLPDDYDDMKEAADVAVAALTKVYGTEYEVGSSTNVLYVASGGSDDWAKGGAGIKYTYTVELRDTGKYGFLLPANQIIPTGIETLEGIKALGKHVVSRL